MKDVEIEEVHPDMDDNLDEDNIEEVSNSKRKSNMTKWTERIGLIMITVILTSFGSFYTLKTLANSSKLDKKADTEYVDKQIGLLRDDIKSLMLQNQAQHEDMMRTVNSSLQLVVNSYKTK
jgi:hypothetical protein